MLNAIFLPGQTDITVNGLHQWDYGQKLQISSADLPALIEVHFSCVGMADAIIRPCFVTNGNGTVTIPDMCLEQSSPITAWVFEIDGTKGTTTKAITLPIISRARPLKSEVLPEKIGDVYTEAVTEINGLIGSLTTGDITVAKAEKAEESASADFATEAGTAASANFATEAGTAASANFATSTGQINGLLIKRDTKGILKIGTTVIPQRKLLTDKAVSVGQNTITIYSDTNSLLGRTLEVIDDCGGCHKFVVDPEGKIINNSDWWTYSVKNALSIPVYFRVEYDGSNLLQAGVVETANHFGIVKIYEIIE